MYIKKALIFVDHLSRHFFILTNDFHHSNDGVFILRTKKDHVFIIG